MKASILVDVNQDSSRANGSAINNIEASPIDLKHLYLPHWIAGRYNKKECIAIIFNNLSGETYLFENITAELWGKLLEYDYCEYFNIDNICSELQCPCNELISFFNELVKKNIILDHAISQEELSTLKKSVNHKKEQFLQSDEGIANFNSFFDSVDNDYRNRISKQGIPFSMSFELTYACNEACIHCYNPNSPREGGLEARKVISKGEMTVDDYFPILDKMKKMGVAKIIFTGGDPFTKRGVMEIIKYAHNLKFAFSVYTNGLALYSNKKIYNELIELYPQYIGLSLYSAIPEVHDSITRRKGSCEKTMTVAKWCYEDAIGLQIKCPIMQTNKDSYGTVYDFAIGVNGMPQFDVNITSGVDGDGFATQHLRMTEDQYSEVLADSRIPLSVENTDGVIERKPDMYFCGAGEYSFNIKPNGTLTPCCAYPMDCGNVKDIAIDELWVRSSKLILARALRYRDSDICGKKEFCKYCNRCIGQSFVEHGVAENHSEDNCFIAKIRMKLLQNKG